MTEQTTAVPPRSPWWIWPQATSVFGPAAVGGTLFELPWRLAALAAAATALSTATTVRLLGATVPQPVTWFPLPVRLDAPVPARRPPAEPVTHNGRDKPAAPPESGPTESGPTESGPTESGPTESGPTDSAPADLRADRPARPKARAKSRPKAPKTISADELPLPAWDSLALGSIRARLRSLDLAQLRVLHTYEEQHAGRPGILSMLENRVTKLEQEQPPSKRGQRARRRP